MELKEIIKEKIKSAGPISFKDFMEMALYYPSLGYYTSERNTIGIQGDFYTSSTVSNAFGAMIAKEIEKRWKEFSEKTISIVEYGAGTGFQSHDILDYFKINNEELFSKLNYFIIEKSEALIKKQKSHLIEKVNWINKIEDISPINGFVISNEVPDNFAVHQVIMEDELMEIFVDYDDGFKEIKVRAGEDLIKYFKELNVQLPFGFRTEINIEATKWISSIAQSLKNGFVITIDYGFLSNELYSSRRREGTINCYYKHTINYNPFINIGEQDITTHINFSALNHWGKKHGLISEELINQATFLNNNGLIEYLQQSINDEEDIVSAIRKIGLIKNKLLMEMGDKFKVLIQEKKSEI